MPFLLPKAGQNFRNTSPLDMKRLMGDQDWGSGNRPGTSGLEGEPVVAQLGCLLRSSLQRLLT